MTTTFLAIKTSARDSFASDSLTRGRTAPVSTPSLHDQLLRAVELARDFSWPGRSDIDDLRRAARSLATSALQGGIRAAVGREHAQRRRSHSTRHCGELAQVHAESGRRTRAAESLADLVIAAAARDRIRPAAGIGREHHAAVIVITAQLGQIKTQLRDVAVAAGVPICAQRVEAGLQLGIVRQPLCARAPALPAPP